MSSSKLTNVLVYLSAALVALVPFHAFLTVWLASNFGHYTAFRLWIEVVIDLLFLGVLYVVWERKIRLSNKQARWLWWLGVGYVTVHVLLGIIALSQHTVNLAALGDGLVLNLRLLAIFWIAAALTSQSDWLRKHWLQLLLWPALIVVLFGLLQHFVLPIDFLHHFGYGPKTILPYETVNQKLSLVRVMSTQRGANPLGAYLVVVIAMLVAAWIRFKKWRVVLSIFLPATLIVLFFTYSRSAWLGSILAAAVVAWLSMNNEKVKQGLTILIGMILIAGGVSVLLLHNNSRFEDVFLHTDRQSTVVSSNYNHVSALKSGLHDIAHNPLGRGPGMAGPASTHNDHPARIAENYYVQLGQEVGILGAGIFIAINVIVGGMLWRQRKDPLAVALFASLLGITLINLFSHAWTDDTLAIIWWVLAGVASSSGIIKPVKHDTQKTKEKTAISAHPAR